MLLINKSQKSIDGIKPNERIMLDNEIANKLIKMYPESFIIIDGEIEDLKKRIIELEEENKSLLSQIENQKCNCSDDNCNVDIESLRDEFELKYLKKVPVNKVNDFDWIKKQLRG